MSLIRTAITLLAITGLAVADEPPQNAKRSIRVIVLDPQGKPLPDATIHNGIWSDDETFNRNRQRDHKTDAAGAAEIALPNSLTILRLWAGKDPFTSMFANWEQGEIASGKGPPAEYTFRLEDAVSAGGRVVDEQGKPVVGAKVEVRLGSDPKLTSGDGRVKYNGWLSIGSDAVTTDADGRWRIDNVPNLPQVKLGLQIFHSDYVSDGGWKEAQTDAGTSPGKLREIATVTLKRGVIVTGRVTDPAGQPIKDAIIIFGDRPYFSHSQMKFVTDSDGRYRLPAQRPAHATLSAMAPGFAPQLHKVNLTAELPPQNFRMASGKPIKLRIVGADNAPIADTYVSITGWRGSESIQTAHNPNQPKVADTQIPKQSDANGEWLWSAAPDDPVKLQIVRKGFATQEIEIAGGAAMRTIVLKPKHDIAGLVTDAETGQPIPNFTVMRVVVFRKDNRHVERDLAVPGKNGQFSFHAIRTDYAMRLRVDAKGYRTQTGSEFRAGDDASLKQSFRLQPSSPIAGIVLDPSGQPAVKIKVALATPTEQAIVGSLYSGHDTTTDDA